ncbi:MAG: VanZ family protein [Bacteroidales bacterium]|nr:VanZ family protein [Bacteroidales bacterium]
MSNIIRRLIPVSRYLLAVWVLLIIVASSVPGISAPKIETGGSTIRLDYIIHFIEYGGLAFLAILSFTPYSLSVSLLRLVYLSSGLVLFALADEFHQLLIPGRTFNPLDIAFNIGGILAGVIITAIIIKRL